MRISDWSSYVCSSDLEHDAVAGGKIPFAAFGFDANVVAKITAGAQRSARRFVEFAHLGIGMGENDPAGVRIRLPVAIPALDQVVARRSAERRVGKGCVSTCRSRGAP